MFTASERLADGWEDRLDASVQAAARQGLWELDGLPLDAVHRQRAGQRARQSAHPAGPETIEHTADRCIGPCGSCLWGSVEGNIIRSRIQHW